ncbi:hypothetical protein GJ496_003630 [Pomphorhynchus laevis]|nr:hypothetical protein GJ496_003630 [Pomphorhynchus laevis]
MYFYVLHGLSPFSNHSLTDSSMAAIRLQYISAIFSFYSELHDTRYPATPFGILPLTPSFHAPNPATAASMFVGQEHLFDSSPIRRSRFPGSGRRYSESVAVSNRPSSNALMHDISVGESLGRQNNVQDNRPSGDDYRRKLAYNSSQQHTDVSSSGDHRRPPFHRRRGGSSNQGGRLFDGNSAGSQSKQYYDSGGASKSGSSRGRGSNTRNFSQSSQADIAHRGAGGGSSNSNRSNR